MSSKKNSSRTFRLLVIYLIPDEGEQPKDQYLSEITPGGFRVMQGNSGQV